MKLRDFALLVAVCLIWASNSLVSKYAVTTLHVPPLFFAAARFTVLSLALCRWLLPMPKPAWRIVVVGLLVGGGSFGLIFVGLKDATPSATAVVSQLGVPLTIIFSMILLGERLDARRAIGTLITIAGAVIVIWNPHGFELSGGLTYILAATVCGSLGSVLMKQLRGIRPLQYQAWVGFTSAWPMIAMSLLLEHDQREIALSAGWQLVAVVLYSALVVSAVAHTAFFTLIQKYDASLMAVLSLMMPLFTIIGGVVLFHDPFGPKMIAGSLLALTGVAIIVTRPELIAGLLGRRRAADPQPPA